MSRSDAISPIENARNVNLSVLTDSDKSEKEQLLQESRELTQQIIGIHRRQQEISDRLWEIDLEEIHREQIEAKQEERLSTFAI